MRSRKALSSWTLGAGLVACLISAAAASRAGGATTKEGEEAFLVVAKVLQSPRCRNCHPSGDAPLQGDDKPAPHAMNVSRASNAAGLACHACHRQSNSPIAHGPPGVPGWHMPPAIMPMVFEGLTPRALCAQLKDPAKTGGRDLEALREHMAKDPLVLWAWAPGSGRAKPPVSHAELVKNVGVWIDAGAPCPP